MRPAADPVVRDDAVRARVDDVERVALAVRHIDAVEGVSRGASEPAGAVGPVDVLRRPVPGGAGGRPRRRRGRELAEGGERPAHASTAREQDASLEAHRREVRSRRGEASGVPHAVQLSTATIRPVVLPGVAPRPPIT